MDRIEELYFFWILTYVCHGKDIECYRSLLEYLYFKEFRWTMELDENVAIYGLKLREDYFDECEKEKKYKRIFDFRDKPCSVLEMMVALAINMETKIMSNDAYGDRTYDWFWDMIENLGLDIYDERHFDDDEIDKIVEKFMDRRYKSNGKGGLFVLKTSKYCVKSLEIWAQATNYLSEVAEKNGEIW